MTTRRYDAHVKARRALLRRVVNRRYEWGILTRDRRGAAASGLELDAYLMRDAAKRLARYQWHDGWGIRLGPYYPFAERDVLGLYHDVPISVVHQIMCTYLEEDPR